MYNSTFIENICAQAYAQNYRQPSKSVSRSGLPQGRAHQMVIRCQVVSPKSTLTHICIQICIYAHIP